VAEFMVGDLIEGPSGAVYKVVEVELCLKPDPQTYALEWPDGTVSGGWLGDGMSPALPEDREPATIERWLAHG